QAQLGGVVPKIFGDLFTTRDYEFESVIQQHLYEPLSLEDLAFLTGLSLSSFKRKFAARYGSSPTKYMITKRLEKAHLLLETSAMRITEIAYACGFSEVGHFSKTFRSHYQLAPTEVRKRSDASE
ncbi:MAG TPA: AraC family transcriptional regulator, partial [Cytophagales bacterium]|nr:AraC family transcriptional regulator [Cytophagales bacterium]